MGFVYDKNTIYVGRSCVDTQFSANAQDTLFAIEDTSWWFQYRAQVLIDMAERYFVREVETLDIGGGNGYTTSRLQQAGFRTALIEPSYEACIHAKQRGIPRCFCGELNDFDEPISQCMMLDVLEHIEDDAGVLCSLHAHMSAGGGTSVGGACTFHLVEQRGRDGGAFPALSFVEFLQAVGEERFPGDIRNILFQLSLSAGANYTRRHGAARNLEAAGKTLRRGTKEDYEGAVRREKRYGRARAWLVRGMGAGAVARREKVAIRKQHFVRGKENVGGSAFNQEACPSGDGRTR